MSFQAMRGVLAGGVMAVAVAGAAYAQADPKAVFEARYIELTSAMLSKDPAKVGAMVTADYESTDIRGDTHNRAEVIEQMGKMPAGMENMKPETKVLGVKLSGDTAAVDSQMNVQMKRPDETGAEMTLDIAIVSADTWVNQGGVWLLKKSVQKELTVSKDGEVVFKQAN
jgi:Domain of unknown function (DUF4440)